MKQRTPLALGLICACFLCLACALNLLTPSTPAGTIGRMDRGNVNPDEHQHLAYVMAVARGHWPILTRATRDYESHQPPLYYALCAPLVHGLPPDQAMHVCRAVSTVFVLLAILAAYAYARRLLPRHPRSALATAAFVSFLPMNLSQAASVTNDTLLELIGALVLLVSAKLVQTSDNRRWRLVALGILLGLGMWTKTSAIALVFCAWALFAALAGLGRIDKRQAAIEGILVTAVTLAISAPLLVRNTLVYGDPFAARAFRAYFPANHVGPPAAITGAKVTFMSFWGFFDSMQMHYPGIVYVALLPVSIIAAIGFLRAVRGYRPSPLLLQLLALVVLTALSYVGFNLTYFQPQGRYLYTALVPIALAFVAGLREVTPTRWRATAFSTGIAALVLFDLLTVVMIVRHY